MSEERLETIDLQIDDSGFRVVCDETFFVKDSVDASVRGGNGKLIHVHAYYEFFFVSDDGLRLVTEAGEFVYKNAVVIVPPGVKHYSVRGDRTYRMLVGMDDRKKGSEFQTAFFGLVSHGTIRYVLKNEEVDLYLEKINAEWERPTENGELKIKALLTILLLTVADVLKLSFRPKKTKADSSESEYLFKIDKAIDDSFVEDVTLPYLAEKLFLSEKQASRVVKKYFGKTLSELIVDKKLSAAAQLLKNTKKSVSEIIVEVNFQTESYFFVLFRKKYGCTPLAYRKHEILE